MQKHTIIFIVSVLLVGAVFTFVNRNADGSSTMDENLDTASLRAIEYAGSTETMSFFGVKLFEIKIPDGWVVERKSFDQGIVFADQLNYKPGSAFELTEEESDVAIARFNAGWGESSDFPDEYNIYTKKALPNINGHKAEFYEYTFVKDERVGSYVMKGGEKEFVYRILDGGNEVVVSYFVLDGDEENRDLIESVASTVRLL